MTHRLLLFALFVTGASAAPMTYTITGTGSGSWHSQAFSEASFTLTFTADTDAIVHGTSCCGGADSTPAGTAATVTVSGFPQTTLAGNQAIFLNRSTQTAGIWHFDAPEYLTVATPAFANDDLTTTIGPTAGTTFSYVTPLPLSSGGALYFSSVHDVSYSQAPGTSGGLVTAVSVTPNDSHPAIGDTQTFTAVVSDTAGAADIGGVDVQVVNPRSVGIPYSCWLYYNAANNTLTPYNYGWTSAVPIGASGAVIQGVFCTVDTRAVTVSGSGNNLTLSLPITFTSGDGQPWSINLTAQNKNNAGPDYALMGTVTIPPPPPRQEFDMSIAPPSQSIRVGGTTDYTVTVIPKGDLTQPITFSGKAYIPKSLGLSTNDISFTFDPATITGPGTTIMHVKADASISGVFQVVASGASETYSTGAIANLYIDNNQPAITLNITSVTSNGATFVVNWPDMGVTYVNDLNILISSTLDGQHACWLHWHRDTYSLDLAADNGLSWLSVPWGHLTFPTPTPTSNSQCTIDGAKALFNDDQPRAGGNYLGYQYLAVPITFSPAFAGSKTVYVRASNDAGFETGYHALGTWTPPAQ